MAQQVSMSRLLGYNDFFPGKPAYCKEFYGAQLGKELINTLVCHFLGFFKMPLPSNAQFIRNQFQLRNPDYCIYISAYAFIPGHEGAALLSVQALLHLFEWNKSAKIPDSVILTEYEQMKMDSYGFDLMLLFNDEVLKDYQYCTERMRALYIKYSPHKMALAMNFSQTDLVNLDYAQIMYAQMYKSLELFQFMENDPAYTDLLKAFLDFYDVADKAEYIKAMGGALIGAASSPKPGWTTLEPPRNKDFNKNCDFLEKLCLDVPDLALNDDFLAIRNEPLEKLSRGEYRVIFDAFVLKKIYNGSYFRMLALTQADNKLFKKSFAGSFKNEFSEGRLVYDVVSKIFQKKSDEKHSGTDFKQVKMLVEPDYYVRTDTNHQLLFESKDFYIPGPVKISYNYDLIEAELKKRLYKQELDGKTKNGAVLQLVHNIKRSLDKGFILDTSYNLNEIFIYPIILVHDALYSATGLNFEVNQWMNIELMDVRKLPQYTGFDFNRILPLTIIEIDTLILYQEFFSSHDHSLPRLINLYHKHTQMNYKGPYPSPSVAEAHVLMSILPFAEFVRDYFLSLGIHPSMNKIGKLLKAYGIS